MNRPSLSRWLRRTELALFLTGLSCAAFCVFIGIDAASARRASEHLGGAGVSTVGGPAEMPETADTGPQASATVMGRLEIPAISLSVPILSNYESASLLKGIGHIPGTAMPGGLGTLGLAGHRDTYFRPLARIRPKMDIRVIDRDGTYHYAVDSTEIVKPEDVSVLDIQSRPELTLITCYPFHYVGSAPLRFIVHARLISVMPDPAN